MATNQQHTFGGRLVRDSVQLCHLERILHRTPVETKISFSLFFFFFLLVARLPPEPVYFLSSLQKPTSVALKTGARTPMCARLASCTPPPLSQCPYPRPNGQQISREISACIHTCIDTYVQELGKKDHRYSAPLPARAGAEGPLAPFPAADGDLSATTVGQSSQFLPCFSRCNDTEPLPC